MREIVDFRPESPSALQAFMSDIYEKIARSDLAVSAQDDGFLLRKARRDLGRLGQVQGKRVLEIGPGLGHLTQMLIQAGARVAVLDISSDYLHSSRFSECEGRYLAYIDDPNLAAHLSRIEPFDLVISCDVLEHLSHPSDALLNVLRLLKPGGRFYVRVPANETLLQYSRILNCQFELVHLRTFSTSSLRRELFATGFNVIAGPRSSREALTPRSRVPGQRRYWLVVRRALQSRGENLASNSSLRNSWSFLDALIAVRNRLPDRSRWLLGPLLWLLTVGLEIYAIAEAPTTTRV
jgi:SAM-dependent methyltransferase